MCMCVRVYVRVYKHERERYDTEQACKILYQEYPLIKRRFSFTGDIDMTN